ncbi:MAG: hypothetical protein H8E55_61310 [Pelagibacterales bacterium]|nr:hypothetical protein [Pelagibacterales bacterium]
MEAHFNHFIKCTYRPCYRGIFNFVIKPFLNDVILVEKVLKTDIILENKGNVYIMEDGVKLFSALYVYLTMVASP